MKRNAALPTLHHPNDVSHPDTILVADTSLSGGRVARELTALVERYCTPRTIVSNNGTEFTSLSHRQQVQADWQEDCNMVRAHSQPSGGTLNQFARLVSRGHPRDTSHPTNPKP